MRSLEASCNCLSWLRQCCNYWQIRFIILPQLPCRMIPTELLWQKKAKRLPQYFMYARWNEQMDVSQIARLWHSWTIRLCHITRRFVCMCCHTKTAHTNCTKAYRHQRILTEWVVPSWVSIFEWWNLFHDSSWWRSWLWLVWSSTHGKSMLCSHMLCSRE